MRVGDEQEREVRRRAAESLARRRNFPELFAVSLADALARSGHTLSWVASQGGGGAVEVSGLLAFRDEPRSEPTQAPSSTPRSRQK